MKSGVNEKHQMALRVGFPTAMADVFFRRAYTVIASKYLRLQLFFYRRTMSVEYNNDEYT